MKTMQQYLDILERKNKDEETENMKLKEEFLKNIQKHEEEV